MRAPRLSLHVTFYMYVLAFTTEALCKVKHDNARNVLQVHRFNYIQQYPTSTASIKRAYAEMEAPRWLSFSISISIQAISIRSSSAKLVRRVRPIAPMSAYGTSNA